MSSNKKVPLNEKYNLEFIDELNILMQERIRRLNEVIAANNLTYEELEKRKTKKPDLQSSKPSFYCCFFAEKERLYKPLFS